MHLLTVQTVSHDDGRPVISLNDHFSPTLNPFTAYYAGNYKPTEFWILPHTLVTNSHSSNLKCQQQHFQCSLQVSFIGSRECDWSNNRSHDTNHITLEEASLRAMTHYKANVHIFRNDPCNNSDDLKTLKDMISRPATKHSPWFHMTLSRGHDVSLVQRNHWWLLLTRG